MPLPRIAATLLLVTSGCRTIGPAWLEELRTTNRFAGATYRAGDGADATPRFDWAALISEARARGELESFERDKKQGEERYRGVTGGDVRDFDLLLDRQRPVAIRAYPVLPELDGLEAELAQVRLKRGRPLGVDVSRREALFETDVPGLTIGVHGVLGRAHLRWVARDLTPGGEARWYARRLTLVDVERAAEELSDRLYAVSSDKHRQTELLGLIDFGAVLVTAGADDLRRTLEGKLNAGIKLWRHESAEEASADALERTAELAGQLRLLPYLDAHDLAGAPHVHELLQQVRGLALALDKLVASPPTQLASAAAVIGAVATALPHQRRPLRPRQQDESWPAGARARGLVRARGLDESGRRGPGPCPV